MNLKILLKAMGYMFLPTLCMLLMLLVGFFDPIKLWIWITSNSGGAIFVRLLMFILEVTLIVILYFYYLDKEELKEIAGSSEKEEVNSGSIGDIFESYSYNDKYYIYRTNNPNRIILERKRS